MAKGNIKVRGQGSIDKLLITVNRIREASGAKPLKALKKGVPGEGEACLITRNLEFYCQVVPKDKKIWYMIFPCTRESYDKTVALRDAIAKATRWTSADYEATHCGVPAFPTLILPQWLGREAWAFDNEAYPAEFYA